MARLPTRRIITIHDERDAVRHARGLISVIDDDQAIREAVISLLGMEGYATETFDSAAQFLEMLERAEPVFPGPQCILLDVKMPGLTGLELQRRLIEQAETVPIIFMSGGSGAREAVQALKNGALDFLVKPFDEETLLAAVSEGLDKYRHNARHDEQDHDVAARLASLTEREVQIAKMVSEGMLNRDIADKLGIAVRTVKLHRMHMMRKLGVANVIELAHIADRLP
jgi:FixJ family two-component response regulator